MRNKVAFIAQEAARHDCALRVGVNCGSVDPDMQEKFDGADPPATRRRLRRAKWWMTGVFLALGLATLGAYMRIGIEHAPRHGERYVPTWQQPGAEQ